MKHDPLDEVPFSPITSNLVGGGTVEFDVPNTSKLDTPEDNPIEKFLKAMPTANETAPD